MAEIELEVTERKWMPGYEPIQGSSMHPRRKALMGLGVVAVVAVIALVGTLLYQADSSAPIQSSSPSLQAPVPPVTEDSTAAGIKAPGPLQSGLRASATCTNTLATGTITLPSGRTFELHVDPKLATGVLHPIVFIWHGLDGTTMEMEDTVQFKREADAEDWLLVYPISVGSWPYIGFKGKGCCDKNGADDMTYAKDIIAYLEGTMCADGHKVFSTGFSNGGFMTHKLACDAGLRPDGFPYIAGAAPHSGLIGEYSGPLPSAEAYTGCQPPKPVPILSFEGTVDKTVPPSGANPNPLSGAKWYSFEDTKKIWLKANGCTSNANALLETLTSTSTCQNYGACGVRWCTVQGLDHHWSQEPTNADATTEIISFFKTLAAL